MATVNFSVPDELEAVEREKKAQRRAEAIDRILARRDTKEPVSEEEIRKAREEGRP
jgi:hypothetical protein